MLFLILNEAQPEILVWASGLKDEIGSRHIKSFNNDIKELNQIQSLYEKILASKQTHDDTVLYIFRALKTCLNQEFLDSLQIKRDNWQEGKVYTLDKVKDIRN